MVAVAGSCRILVPTVYLCDRVIIASRQFANLVVTCYCNCSTILHF